MGYQSERSKLVRFLEGEMASAATAAVRTPKKDNLFDYGELCGRYAMAERILVRLPDFFADEGTGDDS